jgi:hypothetical protein
MKIEIVRRLYPPEFDANEEMRFIRGTAKAAGIVVDVKAVPGSEPLRHEDGFPSPITIHRMDVTGRAALQDISLFIEFLGKRDWRAGDLERLQLQRDREAFRFTARLALPTFQPVDPQPGLARQRTNLALAVARAKPQRLIAALKALADIPDDEGVYVASAEVTDRLSMEGVVLVFEMSSRAHSKESPSLRVTDPAGRSRGRRRSSKRHSQRFAQGRRENTSATSPCGGKGR